MTEDTTKEEECSIGSAGSLMKRILSSHTISWETNSSSIHTSDGQFDFIISIKYETLTSKVLRKLMFHFYCSDENVNENGSAGFQLSTLMHKFLMAVGVTEYEKEFIKQRIDMEALFMLTDEDLVTLGIPLGPRRKLLNAIKEYKQQSDRCKEIFDKK